MDEIVENFYAGAGLPQPVDGPPLELAVALAEALSAGRRAWPGLVVEASTFANYVGARLEPDADLVEQVRALRASDLYLACACAFGVPGAVSAFEETFLSTLGRAFDRIGVRGAMVDEVKQLLRIRLFVEQDGERPTILSYAGRGELKNWVRASATRLAHRLRGRDAFRQMSDESLLVNLSDGRDFELDCMKRAYHGAFEQSLRDAFDLLATRDRNLLRYYVGRGLSIDQLGVMYHVHRATAARRIRSATEALVARTRDVLARRLGIRADEISGVLELVQSQFERVLRAIVAT